MSASITMFVFSGFGTFLPKFYQVIDEILKLGPQFCRIHFYYVLALVPFPGFLIKYRNIGPHSWSTSGNGSIWFCAIQISSQGCLGPSMEYAGRLMYGCWPFHKFADFMWESSMDKAWRYTLGKNIWVKVQRVLYSIFSNLCYFHWSRWRLKTSY